MENLKKAMIIRNGNVVGAVGDKNFSTAPIGTVLAYAGNEAPRGYLLADGASYPTTEYPDLYAVIGNTYGGDSTNFNVPDFRETVLVGVGENTTDTIADHDVYGLGEFKDDQLQGHWHNLGNSNGTVTVALGASAKGGSVTGAGVSAENRYTVDTALDAITDGTNGEPRKGTTTHGKQKGVTYIIKAFHTNEGVDSGVSDDVVEYLASELKTSENTDKTSIVYDAYMSSTTNESNFYIVRNGICYVYMDFTMTIDNPSGKGILLEKIPKPIGVINCQAMLYNNSTAPQGMLVLNTDGAITAEHNLKLGERYLCNFSYPIA